MPDDPIEYSCQQNFVIATTDGYWSGRNGKTRHGSIPNQDAQSGTNPPFYDGGSGAYDPDGTSSTFSNSGALGDVALYYYQTDLRQSGAVSENNVPTREDTLSTASNAKTPNWQHMITFGLGMAEGLMDWREDYESKAATGDFDKVRAGFERLPWTAASATGGCRAIFLQPGRPLACSGERARKFFTPATPRWCRMASPMPCSACRSATPRVLRRQRPRRTSRRPTGIYKTSYTTVDWYGEITAQLINPSDGSVVPDVLWSAKDKLEAQVGVTSDSRKILIPTTPPARSSRTSTTPA